VSRRVVFTLILLAGALTSGLAHKPGVTLTWNRDISRVFFARCAECHRKGGAAFSLMTFPDVQPRLTEIQDAILNRRMPPWGAVKGFGDFRNDQALSYEEIELISEWIEAGARKGNNPDALPRVPKFSKPKPFKKPKDSLAASGEITLSRPFILDGLYPERPPVTDIRIVAEFPDQHIEPLLWLYRYNDRFKHPFLLRDPMELPAGTKIRGIPHDAQFLLLPGKKPTVKGLR
jgi:mono/diheme cytochrome c family protein